MPERLVGLRALDPHQAHKDQWEPVPVEPRQAGQQPGKLAGAHLAVPGRRPQETLRCRASASTWPLGTYRSRIAEKCSGMRASRRDEPGMLQATTGSCANARGSMAATGGGSWWVMLVTSCPRVVLVELAIASPVHCAPSRHWQLPGLTGNGVKRGRDRRPYAQGRAAPTRCGGARPVAPRCGAGSGPAGVAKHGHSSSISRSSRSSMRSAHTPTRRRTW